MVEQELEPKVNKTLSRIGSGWSKTDRTGKKNLSCQISLDSLEVSEKVGRDGKLEQVVNFIIYPCKRLKEEAPNYSILQLKDFIQDDFIQDQEVDF